MKYVPPNYEIYYLVNDSCILDKSTELVSFILGPNYFLRYAVKGFKNLMIMLIWLEQICWVAIVLSCTLQGGSFLVVGEGGLVLSIQVKCYCVLFCFSEYIWQKMALPFTLLEILLCLCKRDDADQWNNQVLSSKSSSRVCSRSHHNKGF